MGIQVLNTPTANVTSTVPVAKDTQVKVFQVARTETASVVKLVLPGDASILHVIREGSTVSDAATTATVTITVANNSGTVATKADDVKTSGATTGFVGFTTLPNAQPMPLTGDLTVTAVYAETGTASTTGGPWNYVVSYVR
jgi:hypothetical protein